MHPQQRKLPVEVNFIYTHTSLHTVSLSHIHPYTQSLSLCLSHTQIHTHTLSDFYRIRSLILLEASTRGLWLCLEQSLTQRFLSCLRGMEQHPPSYAEHLRCLIPPGKTFFLPECRESVHFIWFDSMDPFPVLHPVMRMT